MIFVHDSKGNDYVWNEEENSFTIADLKEILCDTEDAIEEEDEEERNV